MHGASPSVTGLPRTWSGRHVREAPHLRPTEPLLCARAAGTRQPGPRPLGPPGGPGVLLQATLQGVGCTGSRPSACPRACPRRWLSACGRRPCLLRGQVRFSGDQWTGAQAVSLRQAAAAEGGAEPQLATHPHSARDLHPLPPSADRGGRACKGDSCGLEWAAGFSHSHSEPAFLSPFLEKRGRRCRSARDAAAPAASAFFRPRAALPERAKFTPRSPLNRSERLSRHFTTMTVIR